MPSAILRPSAILFAGLALSLLAPAAFAQTTKQTKKTATQKPAVVAHAAVSETPKPAAQSSHPASAPVKPVRLSMGPEPTFAPMDAWAYTYKAGNGNAVHQAMSMRSPVIETLARATRIQVVGRGTDMTGRLFYEVQTPDSRTGWMEPGSVRFP